MLMMDLYEESCLQLHEMIENDMQTDLDCGDELGSTHLPPLEGMGALDALDPSWLSDSQGPLNSDLDSLDVGLMVNPQTGLPSLSSSLTSSTQTSTISGITTTTVSAGLKKTIGGFTLLTANSSSANTSGSHQYQTTLSIGNSASAATPVTSLNGGLVQNQGSLTPQPLTASNVQALLGQSNGSQSSQPAAKKSRLTGPEDSIGLNGTQTINGGKIFPKPAYSYSCLIAMALKNSKTGSLPVNEIYNFMIENFPYFKTAPNGWKNSVRHNLSLNKCFEKIEKPTTGPNGAQRKGCLWAMNPSKVSKMDEEVQKWSKKDPAAIRRSMAKPERLDLLEKGFLKELYSGGGTDSLDDEEEEEVEETSSIDDEIETMLPESPPLSQDEAPGGVKVKVIDSTLDKFESSPWNTWETLQHQDENKPLIAAAAITSGSVVGGGSSVYLTSSAITTKKAVVNAEGGTLCATSTPNTYIFTPSSTNSSIIQTATSGNSTLQSTIKLEPKVKTENDFSFIR